LIKQLTGKSSHDKLFLVACAIELLRRAQQIDPKNIRALVDFMSRVSDVSWRSIPFSVTQRTLHDGPTVARQYGATPERINDILLESIATFSDIVENGGADEDAAAIFDAVIAELSDVSSAQLAQVALTPVSAAEIFNRNMLTRIFQPVELTPKVLEQIGAEPVLFKGGLTPSRRGPTMRGFAFDSGVMQWHIILESGEFIQRPKNDPAVSLGYTAIYDDPSIELLAYTTLIAQQLEWYGVLGESQSTFIKDDGLGKFTTPVLREFVAKENAVLLENVIDIDRESLTLGGTGATGAVGASVRYAVPDTHRDIVIDATPSTNGPYVTARLVERQAVGSEKVLMRLDYPRQFSARGAYVFPVADLPVSLTVIY
jgi:hypothetical protein